MIFMGIGTMIGPVVIGITVDKWGNKAALSVLSVFILSGNALIIYYNEMNTFNKPLSYFMTFVWGLNDGGSNTFLFIVLGF